MSAIDKILIGLANANPSYGIHPRGYLTEQILRDIWEIGVRRVDSAQDYVHAEEILSHTNLNWRVQTKFKVPDIYNSFEDLLQAAKLATDNSQVECLLIHTPNLYQKSRANQIALDLKKISAALGIPKVGISIYRPNELENLENWQELDLLQFPHNPLDTNCLDWLKSLNQKKLPILQARSIYLQGLLISNPIKSKTVPTVLLEQLSKWGEWLAHNKLDAQAYCARFAASSTNIDEIVVGVDSAEQLENLVTDIVDSKDLPRYPIFIPEEITDPRRWTN